jgi:hypothetical protein
MRTAGKMRITIDHDGRVAVGNHVTAIPGIAAALIGQRFSIEVNAGNVHVSMFIFQCSYFYGDIADVLLLHEHLLRLAELPERK